MATTLRNNGVCVGRSLVSSSSSSSSSVVLLLRLVLILLSSLICLPLQTLGCSIAPPDRRGPYLKEIFPLRSDQNRENIDGDDNDEVLLWATFDFYTGREDEWAPAPKQKNATINVKTGRVVAIDSSTVTEDDILPPPPQLADVTGGGRFSITFDEDFTLATIGASSQTGEGGDLFFSVPIDVFPNGTTTDPNVITQETREMSTVAFVSEKLEGFVYLFYPVDFDYSAYENENGDGDDGIRNVAVAVVDFSNPDAGVTSETYFVKGLPYLQSSSYSTSSDNDDGDDDANRFFFHNGPVFDTIQLLIMPGGGGDCVRDIFLYYNQTGVFVADITYDGGTGQDVRKSISYAENGQQDDDTAASASAPSAPSIYRFDWTKRGKRVSSTTVTGFAISDPETILHEVKLDVNDIDELFRTPLAIQILLFLGIVAVMALCCCVGNRLFCRRRRRGDPGNSNNDVTPMELYDHNDDDLDKNSS